VVEGFVRGMGSGIDPIAMKEDQTEIYSLGPIRRADSDYSGYRPHSASAGWGASCPNFCPSNFAMLNGKRVDGAEREDQTEWACMSEW
jgi:hypothetical protein